MPLFSAINHIEWHIDFILQGLKRGRGAGDTVIAFNIINIISHIISDREAGIRRSRQTLFCQTPSSLSPSLPPSLPRYSKTVSINLISWTSPVTPAGQSHPTISPPNFCHLHISVSPLSHSNAAFCLLRKFFTYLFSHIWGSTYTTTVSTLVSLVAQMNLKGNWIKTKVWSLKHEVSPPWTHRLEKAARQQQLRPSVSVYTESIQQQYCCTLTSILANLTAQYTNNVVTHIQ